MLEMQAFLVELINNFEFTLAVPHEKIYKEPAAVMTPSIVHNALHSTRSCHLPPIPCSAVSPHWLFRGHSFDDAFGHYHVALAIPSPFRISTSSSAATSQPPYSFGRVVGHVEVYGQKQWRGIILYNLYTIST